jgi:hypothetical protein
MKDVQNVEFRAIFATAIYHNIVQEERKSLFVRANNCNNMDKEECECGNELIRIDLRDKALE